MVPSGPFQRQQAKILSRVEDALKNRRLTIVVGAGASINAMNASGSAKDEDLQYHTESLSWIGLLRHGLEYTGSLVNEDQKPEYERHLQSMNEGPPIETGKLLDAAAFVKTELTRRNDFTDWLDLEFEGIYEQFLRPYPNPMLDALKSLYEVNARIITTNYDDLLEQHIGALTIVDDGTPSLQQFFRKAKQGIGHIHGVWWHQKGTVLDQTDYARVVGDSTLQQHLRNMMSSDEVVLFVGTGAGLGDPNFNNLLSWASAQNADSTRRHYVLVRYNESTEGIPMNLGKLCYGTGYEDLAVFLRRLADKSRNNPQIPLATSPSPPVIRPSVFSNVPFPRDGDFVNRGDILDQIHRKHSIPASRVALVGLGGTGKSQLAIEYAHQVRKDFPDTYVFWVHASSVARFEESYKDIALRLGLGQMNDQQDNALQQMRNWLCDERNGQWIMLIDNADDPAIFFNPTDVVEEGSSVSKAIVLARFIPQTSNGRLLFTSRSEELALKLTGAQRNIIHVGPMEQDEGQELVKRKLESAINDPCLFDFLQALEYIPLAITQAMAFIDQMGSRGSISRYLEMFNKSDKSQENLLNKDGGDLRRDPEAKNSIITSWQVSFDQIKRDRPSAVGLLSLMSFFSRQGIPSAVLKLRYIEKEKQEKLIDADVEFEKDVALLIGYSLVSVEVDGETFEIHRLVQLCTQTWLEQSHSRRELHAEFLLLMSIVFPTPQFENWTRCKILYPHAARAAEDKPEDGIPLQDWSDILQEAGTYALVTARYQASEVMLRKALAARERELGPTHPDTLTSAGLLAQTLSFQGIFSESESILKDVIRSWGEGFGYQDHGALVSMSIHAGLLVKQRRYREAEEVNRFVLQQREKTLGTYNSLTLRTMNSLGTSLGGLCKYQEAEKIFQAIIPIQREILGDQHPETVISRESLASTWHQMGRDQAAEELYRQILSIKEDIFGPRHPETLFTLQSLGCVVGTLGRHRDAFEIYQRIEPIQEKFFDKEHPDRLSSRFNLACALGGLERHEDAEKVYLEILPIQVEALGEAHPDTLSTMENLGRALRRMERYEDAKEVYEKALSIQVNNLGKEHPGTLKTMYFLGHTVGELDDHEEAEKIFRETLKHQEAVSGHQHPETLASVRLIGVSLYNQREYEEAESFYRDALKRQEIVLGWRHPDACESRSDLVQTLRKQGKDEEADRLEQPTLEDLMDPDVEDCILASLFDDD